MHAYTDRLWFQGYQHPDGEEFGVFQQPQEGSPQICIQRRGQREGFLQKDTHYHVAFSPVSFGKFFVGICAIRLFTNGYIAFK